MGALEAENAELRRRLGMNSSNFSTPPSKDSIAAKARRRADRSSRERSQDRKPGRQPGRKGSRRAIRAAGQRLDLNQHSVGPTPAAGRRRNSAAPGTVPGWAGTRPPRRLPLPRKPTGVIASAPGGAGGNSLSHPPVAALVMILHQGRWARDR
ncbi:MAG: hypothetical protein ACRDRI_22415 [Pseudonocardiaceae bacterium]